MRLFIIGVMYYYDKAAYQKK